MLACGTGVCDALRKENTALQERVATLKAELEKQVAWTAEVTRQFTGNDLERLDLIQELESDIEELKGLLYEFSQK